mmetsp:Transcript_173249/g.555684  ORF Transcript_173249/g.555684 Transcript_173249/m.555684 type:complete len:291 (+) Transcript_173249:1924-2796(+)
MCLRRGHRVKLQRLPRPQERRQPNHSSAEECLRNGALLRTTRRGSSSHTRWLRPQPQLGVGRRDGEFRVHGRPCQARHQQVCGTAGLAELGFQRLCRRCGQAGSSGGHLQHLHLRRRHLPPRPPLLRHRPLRAARAPRGPPGPAHAVLVVQRLRAKDGVLASIGLWTQSDLPPGCDIDGSRVHLGPRRGLSSEHDLQGRVHGLEDAVRGQRPPGCDDYGQDTPRGVFELPSRRLSRQVQAYFGWQRGYHRLSCQGQARPARPPLALRHLRADHSWTLQVGDREDYSRCLW